MTRADARGRDRDDDAAAQPARRARPAARRDGGHGPLDGRRPPTRRSPGRRRSRRSAARPLEGVLGDARRRVPVRRVRRAQAAHHVGPRDRRHRGPARRPGRGGHERRDDPGPRAVRRVPRRRGRDARAAGRRARRGDGLREPGRRGHHARRVSLADRGDRATTGSSCRRRPGVPGQAAVLARRRGRPADRAGAGARRVRPRARGRPRPRRRGPDRGAAGSASATTSTSSRPRTCSPTSRTSARSTGALPTDRRIVVERFRDELGDWRLCLLTPFGGRVHAPWSLALEARLGERLGARGPDDLVRRRDRHPAARGRRALDGVERAALPGPRRDRGPRRRPGRRLGAVRRRASARTPRGRCSCRAAGRARGRRSGSSASGPPTCWRSPVALRLASRSSSRRTASACRDVFDLPALREVLGGVARREIAVHAVETVRASPFASSLLFDYVAAYMYEGDAPLAERRAQALTLDRDLLRELLGQEELRELLDPAALADLELALQALADDRRATTRRPAPRPAAPPRRPVGRRGRGARARRRPSGATRGSASSRGRPARRPRPDRAARSAGSRSRTSPATATRSASSRRSGVPEAFLGPATRGARGPARALGPDPRPVPDARAGARWGLPVGVVEDAPGAAARRTASLLRGEFRPGGAEREWCDPDVLRQLRRRSLARLRREVEPVDPAALARFLPAWQGVAAVGRSPGAAARHRPRSSAWPRSSTSSPACRSRRPSWSATSCRRAIPGYQPRLLDELGAMGEVAWVGRGQPRPRRRPDRAVPARSRALRAAGRGSLGRRRAAGRSRATRRSASTSAGAAPRSTARSSPRPAAARDREVLDALWDLVWAGEVTNDTFAPLRALRWKRPAGDVRRRPGPADALGPPEAAGRWSLVEPTIGRAGARPPTQRSTPGALALLERHGVLTREAVAAEGIAGGFCGGLPDPAGDGGGRPDPARLLRRRPGRGPVRAAGALDRLRAVREPAEAPRTRGRPPARRRRSGQPVRRRAAVAAPRRGRPPAVRSAPPAPTSCSSTARRRSTSSAAAGRSRPCRRPTTRRSPHARCGRSARSSPTAGPRARRDARSTAVRSASRRCASALARGRLHRRATAASSLRGEPPTVTVPEGDTLVRTAAGLRPYLVGRTVTAARADGPAPVPQIERARRRDGRPRSRRSARTCSSASTTASSCGRTCG